MQMEDDISTIERIPSGMRELGRFVYVIGNCIENALGGLCQAILFIVGSCKKKASSSFRFFFLATLSSLGIARYHKMSLRRKKLKSSHLEVG